MIKSIRLTIQYLRDKDVPFIKKLLIFGSLLYLVFPADIVPDFIIGLGIIDDVTVISFIWLALKSEIAEYGRQRGNMGKGGAKVLPFKNRIKGE